MTPAEVGAALAALFGDHRGALADAARALGVHPDSLRHMLSGRRGVPAGLAAEIGRRLAMREVAAPPATLRPSDDRDGPCCDALRPHLDDLASRACAAGWLPAEVVAAALSWAVEGAIEGGGPQAALELLDAAREGVELSAQPHTEGV